MSNNILTPIQTAGMPLFYRRLMVAALNITSIFYILWTTFAMLQPGGITNLEAFILFCTFICAPPYIIHTWNHVIGLCISTFGEPEKSIYPYFNASGPLPEITSKTALVICMRNEDPIPVFQGLLAIQESLRRISYLQHFRFVILSDTSRPDIAGVEDQVFASIKDSLGIGMYREPLYRRRMKNSGYKAGNIMDYVVNYAKGDDFMVTLDSDSVMGGDLLFGRRHGVRFRHLGTSWWFGDCGLYWGHNAIIRIKAFHENCMLPVLKGKPPLGGHILSHDVIEAIFMRRGGYEVRMLPLHVESYETSPPTFIDYLRREHRWCQGSMQYWFLLKEPGLAPVTLYHVYHVLSSYISPACRLLLTLAGIAKGVSGGYNDAEFKYDPTPQLLVLCIGLIPKVVGIFDNAGNSFERYGGHFRWTVSVVLELIIMTFIGQAIDVAILFFFFSMLSGKSINWDGQNRGQLGLSWRETFRVLWPQTLLGLGIAGIFSVNYSMPRLWFLPFVAGLCLVLPLTVLTASPRFSQFVIQLHLFMAPEESDVPQLLSLLVAPEIVSAGKAVALSRERMRLAQKGYIGSTLE
ncbi:glucans biosynthesis glucosyltransferase H [Verticillium dahliae VdLs.17]|uniref:Glucans biosynthesis glucosyltransferase H n=1 Tax=Verticillium dahliae (strain VdLs.17 / ATCC MYA-4575 / FGSC 10137) TaxID=498257 RepID=G2WUT0_VERDV|nr:glucans biosynthesis glucosyltransferase H [Verticillium dahliae VdLs.17]EGY20055.1 glucans biosynthesis glucosyltransferase H [Verticillium dahliae VdLs.17]KAH6690152.1 glucans biosynthesis glucosyltransferase H [Verticillium dahliae]